MRGCYQGCKGGLSYGYLQGAEWAGAGMLAGAALTM